MRGDGRASSRRATHLLTLLDRGIPVVTANKQLVARHGTELFARAEAAGAQLRFEASVCGAVPIVRMLREIARGDARRAPARHPQRHDQLHAHGDDRTRAAGYDDALADAQRLGYAEPDPTEDVEGIDAAAKLAILAGIAFGTTVDIDDVRATGIRA